MGQSSNIMPAYIVMTRALRRINSQLSAAECHGLIAGALNTQSTASIARFFTDDAESLQQDREFAELISQLVLVSSEGYRDEDFDFQLLLPDDAIPLLERSRALAEWCGGYVMGLLESGLKEFDKLPEDAAEVAKDLVEISQLDASADVGGMDSDLMQLEKYVRVGVQIIYAELTKGVDRDADEQDY
ncbi:MAG: hypothetical protein BMS9Abin25_1494 [Gammaproteobacteria bacterium]|nr:MAG: hypothetical protein BMS9Abin25_1494 [Gammaproteobacteria bacterium]